MEDDRRVDVLAGPEEAKVLYLDSIVQVLIDRYGFETASDLFDEVALHWKDRADSFHWDAVLRQYLRCNEEAASRLLEHHEPPPYPDRPV